MNDINNSVKPKCGVHVLQCGEKGLDGNDGGVRGSERLRFDHKRDILELMSIGWPSR
jgi:hypothetical protein